MNREDCEEYVGEYVPRDRNERTGLGKRLVIVRCSQCGAKLITDLIGAMCEDCGRQVPV